MTSNMSLYNRRRHAEDDLDGKGEKKKLRLEIPSNEPKNHTLNDSGIGNSPQKTNDVEMMDEVEIARVEMSPARKDMIQIFPPVYNQNLIIYSPNLTNNYGYCSREYRYPN